MFMLVTWSATSFYELVGPFCPYSSPAAEELNEVIKTRYQTRRANGKEHKAYAKNNWY